MAMENSMKSSRSVEVEVEQSGGGDEEFMMMIL